MRKFIAVTCAFFITVSLWALEADEIGQLLNGWADAFAVEPWSKLATTWSRIKSNK